VQPHHVTHQEQHNEVLKQWNQASYKRQLRFLCFF
jgi:hypothetical protein